MVYLMPTDKNRQAISSERCSAERRWSSDGVGFCILAAKILLQIHYVTTANLKMWDLGGLVCFGNYS